MFKYVLALNFIFFWQYTQPAELLESGGYQKREIFIAPSFKREKTPGQKFYFLVASRK